MKKTKLVLLFLLFTCPQVFSQATNSSQLYAAADLKTDLYFLVNSIIETHPDPFTVINKTDFNNRVSEIKKSLNRPLSLLEFYRLITPLVASISDGHTAIRYPGAKRLLTEDTYLFPYTAVCNYKEQKFMVEGHIYDSIKDIPSGSEIISINNVTSKEIAKKIIDNTSGENKQYRLKTGSNYSLGILLHIYFDFSGDYTVKYKFKEKVYTKSVTPVTFKQIIEAVKAKKGHQTTDNTPDYSLVIKPELKTAIIDFRYFYDEQSFDVFLKKSFDTIKQLGIKNLIIDICQNGGGNSVLGDNLFKYISPEPFSQFGKTIIKYSQLQKETYLSKCEKDSSYCQTYKYFASKKNNDIDILEDTALIRPNPESAHFEGKIYLLTSLKTFSSAMNFAQCFKHYKMGTIIGEETGGWIVSYGDAVMTTLPTTELSLSISQKKFYTIGTTDKDLHGVVPDIAIDEDRALDYTLSKIKKQK